MVKFECRFNSDAAKALQKHSLKKIWWCFAILTVIMLIVGLTYIIDGDMVLGIILMAVGALFTPFCFLLSHIGQKNSNKTFSLLSAETINRFVFEQDRMTIETVKGTEFHEVVDANYSYLYRIDETADHYFLYTSNRAAIIITKSGLTEGSLEELNDIFARNLGTNFKARKK